MTGHRLRVSGSPTHHGNLANVILMTLELDYSERSKSDVVAFIFQHPSIFILPSSSSHLRLHPAEANAPLSFTSRPIIRSGIYLHYACNQLLHIIPANPDESSGVLARLHRARAQHAPLVWTFSLPTAPRMNSFCGKVETGRIRRTVKCDRFTLFCTSE